MLTFVCSQFERCFQLKTSPSGPLKELEGHFTPTRPGYVTHDIGSV
jgi:hypothetical protein